MSSAPEHTISEQQNDGAATSANDNTCDSMSFFQASPLALVERDGVTNRVDLLQTKYERQVISKVFRESYSAVPVNFEIATLDKIGDFLRKRESQRCGLHISSHGQKDYLALEDKWGRVTILRTANIQNWISSCTSSPPFVFVAACSSRSVGEAFVEAGVKHVICAETDDTKVTSGYAIEFSRILYRALLSRSTLKEAFDLAMGQCLVHYSNQMFCLLPERSTVHNVQILSVAARRSMGHNDSTIVEDLDTTFSSSSLPRPPAIFERHDLEMYRIIDAVKSSRIVWIAGPRGIGKTAVAQACIHYLKHRLPFPEIEEIRWKTIDTSRTQPAEDLDCWLEDLWATCLQNNHQSRSVSRQMLKRLEKRRSLVVLDAKILRGDDAGKVATIISHMVGHTKHIKVVVIHRMKVRETLSSDLPSCVEHDIEVARLSLEATVKLFARYCQHVTKRRSPDIGSVDDLWDLMNPFPDGTRRSTECVNLPKRYQAIFKLIGNGVPRDTICVAKKMLKEDYLQLICLGEFKALDSPSRQSHYALLRFQLGLVETIVSTINGSTAYEITTDALMRNQCIEWVKQEFPCIRQQKKELEKANIAIRDSKREQGFPANLIVRQRRIMEQIKREVDVILGEQRTPERSISGIGPVTLDVCCQKQLELESELSRAMNTVTDLLLLEGELLAPGGASDSRLEVYPSQPAMVPEPKNETEAVSEPQIGQSAVKATSHLEDSNRALYLREMSPAVTTRATATIQSVAHCCLVHRDPPLITQQKKNSSPRGDGLVCSTKSNRLSALPFLFSPPGNETKRTNSRTTTNTIASAICIQAFVRGSIQRRTSQSVKVQTLNIQQKQNYSPRGDGLVRSTKSNMLSALPLLLAGANATKRALTEETELPQDEEPPACQIVSPKQKLTRTLSFDGTATTVSYTTWTACSTTTPTTPVPVHSPESFVRSRSSRSKVRFEERDRSLCPSASDVQERWKTGVSFLDSLLCQLYEKVACPSTSPERWATGVPAVEFGADFFINRPIRRSESERGPFIV